jgi:hypothetical protein
LRAPFVAAPPDFELAAGLVRVRAEGRFAPPRAPAGLINSAAEGLTLSAVFAADSNAERDRLDARSATSPAISRARPSAPPTASSGAFNTPPTPRLLPPRLPLPFLLLAILFPPKIF